MSALDGRQEERMRTMCGVLAAFSLATIATAANAQDPARTPPVPPAPAHETMLLSGCLEAGPDETTFRLTKASRVRAPGDPSSSGGAPSASPEASSTPRAQTAPPTAVATSGEQSDYELKAETRLDAARVAPLDMKAFIGHQVEVTARPLEEPLPPEPARPAAQPQADADGGKPADAEKKVNRLTVTAIKQVVGTCQ
jgi:hypothetical protein